VRRLLGQDRDDGPGGPTERGVQRPSGPTERTAQGPDGRRFVEGFVSASLLFCVGPLTILGSVSDGLGRGNEQLLVKSVLDGTVALVLASTLGIGVGLSALSILVVQGGSPPPLDSWSTSLTAAWSTS